MKVRLASRTNCHQSKKQPLGVSPSLMTKRKKYLSRCLYRTKDQPGFLKKNGWWGQPRLPEILGQTDRVGAKLPIFDLFLLVAYRLSIGTDLDDLE